MTLVRSSDIDWSHVRVEQISVRDPGGQHKIVDVTAAGVITFIMAEEGSFLQVRFVDGLNEAVGIAALLQSLESSTHPLVWGMAKKIAAGKALFTRADVIDPPPQGGTNG